MSQTHHPINYLKMICNFIGKILEKICLKILEGSVKNWPLES